MSREMLSDERLMVQVGQGSPEALEELFERYRDPLWRFLARRVDATARAEELHQDVFLALLQGAQRYEPRSSFRSYLFGIAYNVLLADRRKDRQRAAGPLVEDPQPSRPIPTPRCGCAARSRRSIPNSERSSCCASTSN